MEINIWLNYNKSNFEIEKNIDFVKLVPNFDAKYSYITNEGSVFTFDSFNRNITFSDSSFIYNFGYSVTFIYFLF